MEREEIAELIARSREFMIRMDCYMGLKQEDAVLLDDLTKALDEMEDYL